MWLELVIGFELTTYEMVESAPFVSVTIVLNGRTSRAIEVTLNTRDGSAVCEYNKTCQQRSLMHLQSVCVSSSNV